MSYLRHFRPGTGTICMMLLAVQLWGQWSTSGSNISYTGGNVGIGTSTPSIPLDVRGAMGPTSTENLSVNSGQLVLNSSSGIAMKAVASTLATLVNESGNSILTLGAGSYPNLFFGSGASIGRSNAPNWLDLANSGGPISLIGGSGFVTVWNDGILAQVNTFNGVTDSFSGSRMFGTVWTRSATANGQLSMGISTAAAPYAGGNLLLVAKGNESGAYGHANQSDPTLIVHSRTAVDTATNQWLSFQHNTSDGVIQTGTGSLILNPASGYVGIGTSSPCAGSVANCKLAVKGAVRANEVIVDTGWADYVFNKNYRNAPLSEVMKYIEENHHLPGIPSAAELAENGVSLGDMQAKLLTKIEELTLQMTGSQLPGLSRARRQEACIRLNNGTSVLTATWGCCSA